MTTPTLRGPKGFGPTIEGYVLVARGGFSARYDVDPESGLITREEHELYGESVARRILVFHTAKGGVATSWRLLDMVKRGTAPAGLVFSELNPVMVQGAILANIPIVHRFTPDPVETLRSGDRVRLTPERGELILLEGD